MRAALRWFVIVVVAGHGLVHLLGVVKGFGWADVEQLNEPISAPMGVVWLAAAVLVLAAAVLLARRVRWWWIVGLVAAATSQAVVITSWSDARAGTAGNVVLVLASLHGLASQGPVSARASYRRQVAAARRAARHVASVVSEADVDGLPAPVATYVRRSGAVGRPRVTTLHATIHGRIRGGPRQAWMRFSGEQVNTYGADMRRLFFMDATMAGLPVDVLHAYVDGTATMRVRVASVVPLVHASGAEMDRAETVTLFNDLCIMAPAALVDAPVQWQVIDERHVRGTFTNGAQTVSAVLVFDHDGDLVDFLTEDRRRASGDGRTFTAEPWSTPVSHYRSFAGRRLATEGRGRWHAPPPEGTFTYLELTVDDIVYDDGRVPPPVADRVHHPRRSFHPVRSG